MGKKMTKAGMVLRRAIRADVDANPGIDHKQLRSTHAVGEMIVESALTKTLAEWDAFIAMMPDNAPLEPYSVVTPPTSQVPSIKAIPATPTNGLVMPGLEQGVIKFARKPAKMGTDFIFWIPRVYLKNGLVDPRAEYEVFLRKK